MTRPTPRWPHMIWKARRVYHRRAFPPLLAGLGGRHHRSHRARLM